MNAILGFVQEYRAEKAVEALKRMIAPMATGIRDGKEREVPFSRTTRKFLIHYVDSHRLSISLADCPYLFPTAEGGHISINSVQQYLRRLVRKAGLGDTKLYPHIFRHTFATQFLAHGGSVFHLKEILGHRSLTTTLKYTHLNVSDLKAQHNVSSPVENLMKDNH